MFKVISVGIGAFIAGVTFLFSSSNLVQAEVEYSFNASVDLASAEELRLFLKEKGNGDKVDIRIQSPGGLVIAMYKIIYYINTSKAKITCTVDTYAASAAANIFMSCPNRVIAEYASLFFHVSQICVNNVEGVCIEYRPTSPDFHPTAYYESLIILSKLIRPYLTEAQWAVIVSGGDLRVRGSQINEHDKLKEL